MEELDAETPRDLLSRREKRWSMSSSRLEEIVAELMKPIGDLHHSFDKDISSLLEEYLTQAGLHALDEDAECDPELVSGGSSVPNFPEVALLLQHSASVYGRKVDCLYQHVLAVSDSLQNTSIEDSQPHELDLTTETPSSRRKRKSSAVCDFSLIPLETSAASVREGAFAPPPVLARGLVELEPRVLRPRDVQLVDYAGEPIGLIQDYHLTRPLTEGGVVCESSSSSSEGLRGVSLQELSAAIQAAAPPPLPAPSDLTDPHRPLADTHETSSPPPSPSPIQPTLEASGMLPPLGNKVQRKRKCDVTLDDVTEKIHFTLTKASLRKLRRLRDFSLPPEWISHVLSSRAKHIRALRTTLHESPQPTEFPGWSSEESLAATARLSLRRPGVRSDSDDDGFFEQSSSGESDVQTSAVYECEWSWWAGSIARRADNSAGMDVTLAATKLLHAASHTDTPERERERERGERERDVSMKATPFCSVLRRAASTTADVSQLFLATLFLANSGNIEIVPGPALSLDSFAIRVRTTEPKLYTATLSTLSTQLQTKT